jgi:hypothetical protein
VYQQSKVGQKCQAVLGYVVRHVGGQKNFCGAIRIAVNKMDLPMTSPVASRILVYVSAEILEKVARSELIRTELDKIDPEKRELLGSDQGWHPKNKGLDLP